MAAAGLRFLLLFLFWLALAGPGWGAVLPGLAAAALGAWWSLRLMPPAVLRLRPAALAVLLLRFPWQAITAGIQVACLALDPRTPPRPGYVTWHPALPPGAARDAFLAYASLLPGTLPAGEAPDGAVLIHAITDAPGVAAAMTAEEARFRRAFALDG